MEFILKIILISMLFMLSFQDFRERKVYLWLLLITGSIMSYLHIKNSHILVFLGNILVNLVIIFTVYLILLFYSNWKLKRSITQTFGLGDILFFGILAVGFSTGSFLILFSFSLIFSLLVFLTIKSRLKIKTVPLAGLQSLFIGLIYTINWIFNFTNLYAY